MSRDLLLHAQQRNEEASLFPKPGAIHFLSTLLRVASSFFLSIVETMANSGKCARNNDPPPLQAPFLLLFLNPILHME